MKLSDKTAAELVQAVNDIVQNAMASHEAKWNQQVQAARDTEAKQRERADNLKRELELFKGDARALRQQVKMLEDAKKAASEAKTDKKEGA